MADRAWSRAFTRAARRFYGERNFDGAVDGHNGTDTTTQRSDHRDAAPSTHRPSRPHDRVDEGPGLAP
jgi:hypothetical protein